MGAVKRVHVFAFEGFICQSRIVHCTVHETGRAEKDVATWKINGEWFTPHGSRLMFDPGPRPGGASQGHRSGPAPLGHES